MFNKKIIVLRLPKDDIVLSRDDGLSGSTVSWHDELFTKNPRKTLREILRTNEVLKCLIICYGSKI